MLQDNMMTRVNGAFDDNPLIVDLAHVKSGADLIWIKPWAAAVDVSAVWCVRFDAVKRLSDSGILAHKLSNLS